MGAWSVAAPYPEGAAIQLARVLARTGELESLYLPNRVANRTLGRLLRAVGREDQARRLERGAIGNPRLREVAPLLEMRRLVSKYLPRSDDHDPMQAIRIGLDTAVARKLAALDPKRRPTVLVGLPGASLSTFELMDAATRVFHQVDGHPRARNELLRQYFGTEGRAEEFSGPEAARIEREMELADYLLVPSEIVERQDAQYGIDPRKMLRVPYGVDTRMFAAGTEPRPDGPVTLLYVGQISYRKGLPFLLEAVRGQSLQLTLIGPVVAPEILDRMPDNVTHLSTVSHAELSAAMSSVDGFVIASIEDAFPLVVAEALSSGLPVVAADNVGSAELLTAEDGVIVPTGSPSRLREAMSSLGPLMREDRLQRADRFRQRVTNGEVLDWDRYANQVRAGVDELRDEQHRGDGS